MSKNDEYPANAAEWERMAKVARNEADKQKLQKQVSVKLSQGSQLATLTLGIEATLRNVG